MVNLSLADLASIALAPVNLDLSYTNSTTDQTTYTITSSSNSADNFGTISPPGITTVNGGTSQVYTITPSTGYDVSDVLVDGVSQGAITSYTFNNVSTNHTISVTFTVKLLTVTYNTASNGSFTVSSSGASGVSGGSVTSGGTVAYGSTLIIVAFANSNYYVHSISSNSVEQMNSSAIDKATSYSASVSNITANTILSVTFNTRQYTITSSTGSNGTIDPLGATAVNEGSSQTYTITPNSNYQVADVLTDGTSRGSITTYTFTNVTAAHTISVTFSETPTDPVILSSTVNPNVYNVFLNGTNTTTTHPNNKDFISATYGVDVTDSITVSEAAKIKTFDFNSDSLPIFKGNTSITTFNELKYFTAMTNYQSVPELCAKAFYNCTALTKVTLPATITNLRSQVFEKCSAMKTITFLETAPPVTEVYTFGRYDLMGAGVSSGKQIIIPAGCTAAYTASTVSGGTINYIKTVLIDTCGYTLVEAS